jgi:hypothetical protein
MRLPRRGPGSPSILETLDTHLLAGSEREELPGGEMGDYADQIENHLLLCDAYSGLAELVVSGVRLRPFAFRPVAQPSQQAAAPGMDGIDDQFVRSPRGREVVI